jgi:uncharacterized membrane protein YgdD (TMEM256/DUF423 family)
MKIWIALGAGLAALCVCLGAFGAHALKTRLDADMLAVFETGARYHMYHALGLFAVAMAASRYTHGAITASGWLLVAGIVIFSGSLYALSISGVKILGAITPIGGVCFIAGWICLAYGVLAAGD